ncbi:serine integrase [Mycobacterium phage LastHope]|uniref:Serine integrase n=1 Tax=Mycobacterium phage LastHope TaxID=2015886 RepID=A0A222ZSW3_9CAUD|nr:integrase [Mycobacterium phage LastHope]ASR87211.1 serine integrase [Mycobacterium phage LastHope]
MVYLRQSEDRADDGLGVDRQREECMRLLTSRGWTLQREYVDNDVSATKSKPRPQFEEMMKAVDAGEVDVIVSRHLDRLLRRLAELERTLERCAPVGAAIITASDGIDTSTDGGRTTARILASVAQGEIERKSARQLSQARQAAKAGKWVGGRRPFGYEADGMTIRDCEADLVRQGYADILAGESLAEVARRWNTAGMTGPQYGKPWTFTTVREVLTNARHAGLRRHGPTQAEIRRNPEVGIVAKAEWPPLVDEMTWRAAVRIIADPSKRRGPTRGYGMLTGVCECGVCGAPVRRGTARRGIPAYKCETGKHVSRRCELVDMYVSGVVLRVLKRPDAVDLWTPERPDAADLLSKVDVLRSRIEDIGEDYADGLIDRAEFRAMRERAMSNLAEVEGMIAAAGATSPLSIVASADIDADWLAMSIAQKRALISALCTVVLLPAGQGARKFDTQTVVFRPRNPAVQM